MTKKTGRRALICEQLETRFVLSSIGQPLTALADAADASSEFYPVIVAGDPKGTPTDSPANRVDPNTTTSPFAGVGSVRISASSGTYICTGTPIDATHVLTAGHCVDINDDGVPDVNGITFNLNYGGNLTSQIAATAWETHPDFTGFNSPSINDDLAVITLGAALPAGVPTYSLATSDMVAGTTHLYMVGYGQSGDGVKGYYVNASWSVKRRGENMADAFYTQDDAGGPAAKEVFRFDFDGRRPNSNTWGGLTLGNAKETTLGGGDSGGPSFVLCGGCDPSLASSYQLAGVNTFTQGFNAPKFGSLGGGINLFPYTSWILGPHASSASSSGGGGGSDGGPLAGNSLGKEEKFVLVMPPDVVTQVSIAVPTASESAASSQVSTDDSDSHSGPGTEMAGTPSGETVVVVVLTAGGSNSDGDAGTSNDRFLKALDAILEDWLPILDG